MLRNARTCKVTLLCVKVQQHITLIQSKLSNKLVGVNLNKSILVIHFGRDFPGQAIF